MKKIVLFDSQCLFCQGSVHFILKRDKKQQINFAALNSQVGKQLLKDYKINDIDSIVFIDQDKAYTKSSAVLHISKYLTSCWKFFFMFLLLPKAFRDMLYDLIAKHRYHLRKKHTSCPLLTEEEQKRFLTDEALL